jgi:hypothetical protein
MNYRNTRGRQTKENSLLSKKVRRNTGNGEFKFLEKAGVFVSIETAVRKAKVREVWCGLWSWS